MQKSETIAKLSKALTAVQKEIQPATKNGTNPHFKASYADLNAVWDTARELLAQNGLSVIQGNSVGLDNTVIVETILAHESGEWVQSELCLPLAKKDPQGVGSAITYGRRYGMAAIVGIVADADDDGNGASKPQQQPPRPANQPKPQSAPPEKDPSEAMRSRITLMCKDLNAAKDSIVWNPAKLNEYVMEAWEVPYAAMNIAQLSAVATDLQKRLTDTAKGGK